VTEPVDDLELLDALRRAEARFRTLVEQMPLITYIDAPYSSDEQAEFISPQVELVLGYPLSDWRASPTFFVDHLHPDDRDRVRDAQRAARESGKPLELEYRMIAADGRIVWLHDSYSIVRNDDGQPWYAQGFAYDVTDRIEAERDREHLLTQAREQNERLRRLDEMKDEFIATVSHELRTPLTSIRGYLELLLDEAELSEEHLSWLQVIDRNAERLQRLVEDLLLTAAGPDRLATSGDQVDLSEVVRTSAEASAPVAAARGIALTCATEDVPLVSGDRVRLGQVVDNLLSNAVKFTREGGTIEVRTCPHEGGARIVVADTGIGIAGRDQAELFERFFRTPSARELAVAGVGLGLSIAKAIVEAHGGTIAFHSEEGQGTTFVVDLPASRTA
jgi:PAS domain S-box-containing protein